MNVLDLFSGIGGFSLGLERAGMRTVAFCEIDPFCRAVLAKHWPGVNIYGDIRGLHVNEDIDVICGGFPCQDISAIGGKSGIRGQSSGLWFEYARIIGELRPRYVIVENVAALFDRGFGDVLGNMAALGYDAEWHCIPAASVGAPHRRDRLWIVAYPSGNSGDGIRKDGSPRLRLSFGGRDSERSWEQWDAEPSVGRVADGVSNRVDRLRSLGNAVVPQIPEIIGRAIMTANE
jgi:DNA (cytosine-5)-methyltransferase 1